LFNQSEGIFGSPPNFLIWLIEKKDNNKIKKYGKLLVTKTKVLWLLSEEIKPC